MEKINTSQLIVKPEIMRIVARQKVVNYNNIAKELGISAYYLRDLVYLKLKGTPEYITALQVERENLSKEIQRACRS